MTPETIAMLRGLEHGTLPPRYTNLYAEMDQNGDVWLLSRVTESLGEPYSAVGTETPMLRLDTESVTSTEAFMFAEYICALRNNALEVMDSHDNLGREVESLKVKLRKAIIIARELRGYIKPYELDDHGPQSEWSRYSQASSNLDAMIHQELP